MFPGTGAASSPPPARGAGGRWRGWMATGSVRTAACLGAYVALGVSGTVVAKAASRGGYKFEPVAVTLLVEAAKLCAASYISLCRDPNMGPRAKFAFLWRNKRVATPFAAVSLLYFVYNLLAYYTLELVQPATYRVLISTKLVWAGLLLHFVQRRLTRRKWIAIGLLFLACSLEQLQSFDPSVGVWALVLLMLQAWSSAAAGVINQLLLQRSEELRSIQLMEKNVFMYVFGVFFNLVFMAWARPALLRPSEFARTFAYPHVYPLVAGGALLGLVTSMLLRDTNVLVKEYANFLELLLVAGLSHVLLGASLNGVLLLAIVLVSYSLYLYTVEPTLASKPGADAAVDAAVPGVNADVELAVLSDDEAVPLMQPIEPHSNGR